jgi:DNA-binding response OmpR family regulator
MCLVAAPRMALRADSQAHANTPSRAQRVRGQRVLVCSSDPALSDLLALNLERSGFGVQQLAWAGAWGKLKDLSAEVDVLVADLDDEQEVACFEAITHLRSGLNSKPLVILGHAWRDAHRMQRWQPCGYVRKPFAITEVLCVLQQLVSAVP